MNMNKEIKPYTQKQLFGLLKMLRYVVSSEWKIVCKIVDNFKDIEVIEKRWEYWNYRNNDSKYYPLDLSNIKTWSTYDRTCISLEFSINCDKKLFCDVKIYEGDNFNGIRKELRFSAKLIFPNKFITEISNIIRYKFDTYLEDRYEKFLEQQKHNWINEFKNQILLEQKTDL